MVVVIQLMGDKKMISKYDIMLITRKTVYQIKRRSFSMNIITQLNASHLTVAFLPYSKNKDVFIITQLNASHLTVAYLPYSKYKDVFIITQFYLEKIIKENCVSIKSSLEINKGILLYHN